MNSQADHRAPEVKTIFLEALDRRAGAERRSYLDEACGRDRELRSQVESLLLAHQQAGEFLDPLAFGASLGPDQSSLTEGPGTIIGRYKLLEKIGEGGMAVVYMAEQTEPIRRKVAFKIIKLGMDTRQVIARFEAERQVLALMDHPSIAKVLDAGATETGRPYFVMELVQGVSITEYCDKNSLSTKDRLALFLQVCNAVQHAHQKGIIHRDIKPSNVMVTHHDGKPIPKVIDFGIAKATNQKLTEKTLFTRYAHIIGTPAYMSPEQAELSDLDIDTRSDIYSLGVLLYELLTGTTPFSEEELRKAGYAEMQRVIREQEPMKPSTRIKTALRRASVPLAGETSCGDARPTKKAGPRWPCDSMGGTPMLREVRGDLDWIVMKSLEKDRARRYETASGLAEDVRRHLEHEPILAREPSTPYRVRKFLRRHRWQTLAVLATVVIAGAAVVLLSLWNRDRLQLAEAEGFRDRSILSQAREQYAKADREAALETIRPILDSPHVGGKAQLLRAGILVDNRRFDEATAILKTLFGGRPEIAGAARVLMVRVLREDGDLDVQKLQEIGEHRREAETLLPQTAEAYFLQAMTALTVKEQLGALDEALRLDSGHYEARRLRAFTYYASRKYDRLRDDALAMTILRPRDPTGYSLRALAWREMDRWQDALADYDNALALTPKESASYLDLTTQRSETLLRMGRHEDVISGAHEALELWPDRLVFRYHLLCALTALGDYDKADRVLREISRSSFTARNEFWFWATKYVFDTLEAGRAWHPPNQEPVGAATLPMIEAQDAYRRLSAKARHVTTNGFSGHWSADGKKLAFSMGVHGTSGVAIYDPATKETELLIVPGKDPKWSPDGQSIVFVRDCQALRLEEFFALEDKNQSRPMIEEEVWVMKSDGTQPRRLARGGSPAWGKDSTHIYYHSRVDRALCSVSVEGGDAVPERIVACLSAFPAVSPEGQRVAYLQGEFLRVLDLATQTLIAQWRVPASAWGGPAWSPAGDELCLGGAGGGENRTGLWIYRFDRNEPAQVLDGQITAASWTPDGTKLVFSRGAYFDIWAADLHPGFSALESLGPGRTVQEHLRDSLALYTRRIAADPQDAYAYAERARYFDCLHDQAGANADMRRWSVAASGRLPLDSPDSLPAKPRHAIDMPFDCELVFSAERHIDDVPLLSVAFGQKGSRQMKTFKIPMFIVSVMGFSLFPDLGAPKARADFTLGVPTNLGPVVNTSSSEGARAMSADGCVMYFGSDRPGGYGGRDVYVTTRQSKDDAWGPATNLGPIVNGPSYDVPFSISADGLSLYLTSDRAGGHGGVDIYVARRVAPDAPWGTPENLGPTINSPWNDANPCISADGLSLYFSSYRPGGFGSSDLWVTMRAALSDPWGLPTNFGSTVNSVYAEFQPSISVDGLALFFAYDTTNGAGPDDIYVTTRTSVSDPWSPRINLGPPVNTSADDYYPSISSDGSTLYWCSTRPGGYGGGDIWQASIIPVVDFNGDGKVDARDMALLVADWGKNDSVCDIGPFAWGDGIVNTYDLSAFLKEMTGSGIALNPRSDVSEVASDAILSWTSVSFAQRYDVYLGTSREAVNSASRSNPQSVLVSQGQTATDYDPAGLLEYSRTYYWRVDFVIASPAPAIYEGPVLKFTTEAYARPLKSITATASSFQRGMGPEKTVDGSGLDQNDGHSTTTSDMWLSQGTQPNWIQYQFDKVYTLHEVWVWNQNQAVEPFIGFGAKTVKIEYSTDGTKWTPLANVPEFAKAPGKPDYVHNTTVGFGGISAKYVKLTIEKGWGATPSVGLSEVRFFYIPDRSTAKP